MRSTTFPVFLAGAFFATGIAADTCETLRTNTDIKVAGELRSEYFNRWYWSTTCKALKPSCVLVPTSTAEVVDIINILKDTDEPFAIKSGGHNPNPHFASVEGGPLISMEKMDDVTLDEKALTVRVGPGNRWDDVIGALDGTGYTVVGGRLGHVGVGGLLLGGGLSFLSAQYGWAANSIVAYEVVLPNATVVTASASQHPDLFLALKGGGNNFGVITAFHLRAYPQGEIWGGAMTFTHSKKTQAKLLAAVRDFTEYCEDEKAGLILVNARATEVLLDVWILFTFYDAPEPPAGIFDNFTDAKPILDTSGTKSYKKLLSEGNAGVIENTAYTITTETMPLPNAENGAVVLGAIHDRWRKTGSAAVMKTVGDSFNVAYQPFTKRMAKIARESGGDMLDIDDDVDRIIIDYNYSHLFRSQHAVIDVATSETSSGTGELIDRFEADGRLPKVYRPLFMNDAYFRQDYWGRLKPERRELAKKVVANVDPEGMWKSRTGGFKP
ncbi:related to FAD dependent oxidoreductase [Cephalotrichum gorgonifer]|uniref:Related to FAD dependent oxidoreductase n=1 Tax=Cephalotrichum gorgonifer TaxID=2041049 RepID=A0AAE8SWH1_9PEZI|nr:related to FAD dependent oxidoreductase [Cephalotrichum gorgonifer]